jgi:hypothetical protein
MAALQSLVAASRLLGIPHGVSVTIMPDLVECFVRAATDLDGWRGLKDELAAQAVFDLAFLGLLAGRGVSENSDLQALQRNVCSASLYIILSQYVELTT